VCLLCRFPPVKSLIFEISMDRLSTYITALKLGPLSYLAGRFRSPGSVYTHLSNHFFCIRWSAFERSSRLLSVFNALIKHLLPTHKSPVLSFLQQHFLRPLLHPSTSNSLLGSSSEISERNYLSSCRGIKIFKQN
jgi:hypothetical protein